MTGSLGKHRVVVAGDGVAASALACRLLARGFEVVVLRRSRPTFPPSAPPVIEALPEATVRLFAEAGLGSQLDEAGAVAVRGFENAYAAQAGRRLEGRWAHVDRIALANACRREARRRGATTVPSAGADAAFATVDATGRAAHWSRPVVRQGSAVATLYTGPGRQFARPGLVVRTAGGWAYRLDHPDGTTVGVVRARAGGPGLEAELAARLGVDDPNAFIRVGARPASVQWSGSCVGPARLAVGDAALAYSPLAGQGLRFAVASALAATAVIESWRDGETTVASEYYRSFVDGARRRHVAKLAALDGEREEVPAGSLDPSERVRFAARVDPVGMNVDGRITFDEACVLDDGGLVRWVGGFDLLRLRGAVGEGAVATVAEIATALRGDGMTDQAASALVAWALRVGVLAGATPPEVIGASAAGSR